MFNIPGYNILCQIYESTQSIVYRGIRQEDQQAVILKRLKTNYPTPEEIRKYKQEYQITRRLNLAGVVKAYRLEQYQNNVVIIFEDFGGDSLQLLLNHHQLTLAEFLDIAIKITDSLNQIHAANIIHKDINPSNIVYNPQTGQIKLIDFGIASVLSQENPTLQNPNVIEGTLAYISPEQTGRMNRYVDYRTDFYSLGVTFYELLTGNLPFDAQDAMELVHCHLAKYPTPPHLLDGSAQMQEGKGVGKIPQAVSDIVLKLLAKTADERYKSALGIQADLVICLMQLEANDCIEPFPVGENDVAKKFQVPQKIYGRDTELAILLAAFNRVANGSKELMLVSGFAGIGKSVLVQELHQPIVQKRGYFIVGKFDQFKQNRPFASLVQAFSDLIGQILTESEAKIADWRSQLLEAFGVNGQVIIDVIPKLELIISQQPPVPELSATEAQNRFNRLFAQFIQVFAQAEHPLVIFLDDLQWVDSASVDLLERLLTDVDSRYLLIIAAYRDNEINPVHSLNQLLEKSSNLGVTVNKINLNALDLIHLNQLIADGLDCSLEEVEPLAELVWDKTQGNPFFATQFLTSIYNQGLLKLDFDSGSWQWDLQEISAQTVSDNVVEFIAQKLQTLSEKIQKSLQLAAGIGNVFDLTTLAAIYDKSPLETAINLWEAVQEGLIIPLGEDYKFIQSAVLTTSSYFTDNDPNDNSPSLTSPIIVTINPSYRFIHDRIQQAAYSLIPETEQPAIHRRIGQFMLKTIPPEKQDDKLFDIVNQLNIGIPLITSQSERDELAQLNLLAGQKAKAATAYESAANYLTTGLNLLATDSWRIQYNLTVEIYYEAAEAAYLRGNFAEAKQLGKVSLDQANALRDRVKLYELMMQISIAENQLIQAIDIGLETLKMLDVFLVESNGENGQVELPSLTELDNFPQITDPHKKAAMRILVTVASATYLAKPDLLFQVILTMVNLCQTYGLLPESTYAYSVYGLLLCGILGKIEEGYYAGELALRLLDKLEAKAFKCKVLHLFNVYIHHWKAHAKDTLIPLRSAIKSGLETGDLEYAGYCMTNDCTYSFFIGTPLDVVEKKHKHYIKSLSKINHTFSLYLTQLWRQLCLNLIGEVESVVQLRGDSFDEQETLPYLHQTNNHTLLFFAYLAKEILSYLFKEFNLAISVTHQTEAFAGSAQGLIVYAIHLFYNSLILLAQYPTVESSEQEQYLNQVIANQEKMQHWANYAPMNYQHKYDLVAAEKARILGDFLEAMDDYDHAIQGAREHGYIQEEALAYERAAEFYLSLNRVEIAQTYMTKAHYCYSRWGANAKVRDLEERYSQLIERRSNFSSADRNTSGVNPFIQTSDGSDSSRLDLTSVLKASQALSGEILLDQLLAKFMQILIENAGATQGYLILSTQGKLLIEAEAAVNQETVKVLQSIPVENSTAVVTSIINYVARTHETVVLHDAMHQGKFTQDIYVMQNQSKSILCSPLLNQGKLSGLIYLENDLTTGAFTSDRLELLKLLSSQATISIDNAKLYAEIRSNENRLSQFLEAVPVGVAVIDKRGKSHYLNQRAQELLGKGIIPDLNYDKIAEIYQNYVAGTKQLYPNDKLPMVKALLGEYATADDIEIHHGDRIIPIEAWGTPIFDEQGNVIYAIVAFQDITERRQAEAEHERFTQKLSQLNLAFSRFVPRQFLQFLDKDSIVEVQVGDQVQKEMSVLFSDIRDFTQLSETMTPDDNFKLINSYLQCMEPTIVDNQGFIDKYIGDGIMALFGGEVNDAVNAGIAMLHRLRDYNQERRNQGDSPLRIGIGINTGSLMLGTVGGCNRMDTTVISDAVNLASRVEGLTKEYGVSLLISHHTFLGLQHPTDYAIRLIGQVQVKGKAELVTVYEVFDADSPEIKAGKLATLQLFTEALSFYHLQVFEQAAQGFEEVLRLSPRDRVAQLYLKRIRGNGVLNVTA